MLSVSGVSINLGARSLLSNVSFVVNRGACVAVIGRNGSGKSTLMRAISGEIRPDEGSISLAHGTRVGYLPQQIHASPDAAVGGTVRAGRPDLYESWKSLQAAAQLLSSAPTDTSDVYETALARYESQGGYETEVEIEQAMRSVDLPFSFLDTPFAQLSGGMQTRVGIASMLFSNADLLLMDEPTNHLDLESLEWLEGFLRGFAGGVLLITHDRMLLNRSVDDLVYLDDATQKSITHRGTYDSFEERLKSERRNQLSEYRDQQAEIRKVEADIRRTKQQAQRTESATSNDYIRGRAKKVARKAKSREKSLERYVTSDERVDRPGSHWELKIDFPEVARGGNKVAQLEDVTFGYGSTEMFGDLNTEITFGERIVILGPNGIGKTTLLKLLVGEVTPIAGTITTGAGVIPGYLRQDVLEIEPKMTPVGLIRQASGYSDAEARTYLHYFLFEGDAALTPVSLMSFGERKRLDLATMIVRGVNLLLLDEPMNHMDIEAREKIELALDRFPGTIVAVTHDREFARRFGTRFWVLQSDREKVRLESIVDPEAVRHLAETPGQ
ncbi:MAG: ABC-F family ATP-binding cassette domain-containing protein [Chloroflexi bacterium]|nr:ABC-F family ATP-binding cassette domain-containing protein [Chloroflexota bacterium]